MHHLSFLMASHILLLVFFMIIFSIVNVWVVESLCVANLSLPANIDGIYPCKDPKLVSVDDFSFSRLQAPPTTTNERDSIFTPVYDHQIPGLNTLGISTGLFDFGKGGYVPPHLHPETTEIITVIKGSILINFNTSAPENRQFSKLIRVGDVFVVPKGHHHVVKNVGQTDAAVIATFSNQNPELVYVS